MEKGDGVKLAGGLVAGIIIGCLVFYGGYMHALSDPEILPIHRGVMSYVGACAFGGGIGGLVAGGIIGKVGKGALFGFIVGWLTVWLGTVFIQPMVNPSSEPRNILDAIEFFFRGLGAEIFWGGLPGAIGGVIGGGIGAIIKKIRG
jgi:hypothetical protein